MKDYLEQFDIITVLDVLEHIPQNDGVEFLKGCKSALKEDGVLIIQVANIQSAESFLHRYNDLTHVFGYSLRSIR